MRLDLQNDETRRDCSGRVLESMGERNHQWLTACSCDRNSRPLLLKRTLAQPFNGCKASRMFLAARGVTDTPASDGPGLGHAGLVDREDGCAGIGQPALSELLQPAVATRINLPVMVFGATEVQVIDQ